MEASHDLQTDRERLGVHGGGCSQMHLGTLDQGGGWVDEKEGWRREFSLHCLQ